MAASSITWRHWYESMHRQEYCTSAKRMTQITNLFLNHVASTELWHESRGGRTRRPPMRQNQEAGTDYARAGWGRGTGNYLLTAETSRSNFSSANNYPDPGRDFNMSFDTQCSISGSGHGGNNDLWRSKSNLRGDVIYKDAGVGWGRGRGRGNYSSTNLPAGQLYGYNSYDMGSTSSDGSWRKGAVIDSGSSSGSRAYCNLGRTNTAWTQNCPVSWSFDGQQRSNGRDQHGFKTNSSSYDWRNIQQ
ncbi:OLC1v1004731C1 [Oldenlandia corymbosa var. corymbosa]|uniref:OLC1v1004731C1 n=1 Tax=Oldenlandia corymbosa var. corymbosa TaxID=529605 RepID=A0AAV1DGF2_OLDCO|nr:OLC1v1004731C1 [Oldenlandia corymbosa var. corymbosa]